MPTFFVGTYVYTPINGGIADTVAKKELMSELN